jgi:hypothetical protein
MGQGIDVNLHGLTWVKVDVVHNRILNAEGHQTIMPMNSVSPVSTVSQNDVQADVDALSHSLSRWARYPVTAQRAHELTAEFVQLNAAVQAGAAHLRFDDEPSAYAAWLQSGPKGG